MAKRIANADQSISRDKLAVLLNEDLAREYQAIIAYKDQLKILIPVKHPAQKAVSK